MFQFNTPINLINGVGKYYQAKLEKLGIKTVRDLFFHFPKRYEDFSNFKNIEDIEIGEIATITGKIADIKTIRTWKRKMFITEAIIEDETDSLRAIWFNQPYISNTLKIGNLVSLAGKIAENDKGVYLSNPSYEKIYDMADIERRETGGLVPVYSETAGLTSRGIRFLLKKIWPDVKFPADPLPINLRQQLDLPELKTSLEQIHFPDSIEQSELSQKRFSFEDLFILELLVFKERKKIKKEKSFRVKANMDTLKDFADSLNFQFTLAQRRATLEILRDLAKPEPMNRLLEGDVGSGKTIVAAIAALATVKNNFQVAFMAPTEILSQQHFRTLSQLFKKFEINIGLLTSSGAQISWAGLESKATKKEIAKNCESGKIDIIIGTHSLISKNLKFKDLGLIIIDEQHRFGVEQRASLLNSNKKDGFAPHLLAMTATPIPRTLALTIWGDLDISLINEMPANRKPILTKVVVPENRSKAYTFIRSEIKKGRQVFVICPLITPPSADIKQSFSPLWERKSVTQEYEKLKKQIFPDLNIAMLHGKMPAKEKGKIMKDFSRGEIDILVSTSVIEVGIDIPNAAIMMIEGADRFGLAQLYQFRGRVGRGEHQSYCLLFTESGTKNATDRLDAIVKAKNSFELAEKDLQIRGPGDFLGFRQSGIPDYLMNALKNLDLVQLARDEAEKIIKSDPELKKYQLIKERLSQFQQNIDILN